MNDTFEWVTQGEPLWRDIEIQKQQSTIIIRTLRWLILPARANFILRAQWLNFNNGTGLKIF